MRDLGFKPEGERMAVYQSHGRQNRREHGRKGNTFSWAMFSQKRMMEIPTGGSWKNKRQRLSQQTWDKKFEIRQKNPNHRKGKIPQGVSLEKNKGNELYSHKGPKDKDILVQEIMKLFLW